MKNNSKNWIIIILLILLILFLVPQVFSYGRGNWMHAGYGKMGYDMMGYGKMGYGMMGYGKMGYGMIGLGWLIPAIILILIIAAGVSLGNVLFRHGNKHHSTSKGVCSNCSKPVAADWNTCPHCSTTLKKK